MRRCKFCNCVVTKSVKAHGGPCSKGRGQSVTLREIDFTANTGVGDCHAQPLGLALAASTTLTKLCLSNCNLVSDVGGGCWIAVFVENLFSKEASVTVTRSNPGWFTTSWYSHLL